MRCVSDTVKCMLGLDDNQPSQQYLLKCSSDSLIAYSLMITRVAS